MRRLLLLPLLLTILLATPVAAQDPTPTRETPFSNQRGVVIPVYGPCEDSAMPSRLEVGRGAMVDLEPNVFLPLLDAPGGEPLFPRLYPEDRAAVVDGPVCVAGIAYWLIALDLLGNVGWAAEYEAASGGEDARYLLAPDRARAEPVTGSSMETECQVYALYGAVVYLEPTSEAEAVGILLSGVRYSADQLRMLPGEDGAWWRLPPNTEALASLQRIVLEGPVWVDARAVSETPMCEVLLPAEIP